MEYNEIDIMDVSQFEFNGTFEEQSRMLLSNVRLSKNEVENLVTLFNEVERALQRLWPNCKILPFGSIITGLGIKTSDVDIYAQVSKHLYESEKTCVAKAKKVLRTGQNIQELFAIPNAKVPIIKFYHAPTERNCDINFKSLAGVRNSNLIGFLLHMDPRALPLAVLIKYWSKVHSLTGTNLVPNYCLTMMVIFYLQQKGILPSVYKLQDDIEEFPIDGWNTAFNCNYQHETSNTDSLYKLLGEFFVFYSSFDYSNVISPFAGFVLPKESFRMKQIHNVFKLYKKYLVLKGKSELRIDTALCVQDPFEHDRNCAVAIFPRLAFTLKSHLTLAAHLFYNVHETEFLKRLLTESPQNLGPDTNGNVNWKNKPKLINQIKHQFKNKVLKKTNYFKIKRDIAHKVNNGPHLTQNNQFS